MRPRRHPQTNAVTRSRPARRSSRDATAATRRAGCPPFLTSCVVNVQSRQMPTCPACRSRPPWTRPIRSWVVGDEAAARPRACAGVTLPNMALRHGVRSRCSWRRPQERPWWHCATGEPTEFVLGATHSVNAQILSDDDALWGTCALVTARALDLVLRPGHQRRGLRRDRAALAGRRVPTSSVAAAVSGPTTSPGCGATCSTTRSERACGASTSAAVRGCGRARSRATGRPTCTRSTSTRARSATR